VNLPSLERLQRIAVIVSTVANVVHNAIGELRVELADLDPNSSNNNELDDPPRLNHNERVTP
jgi:23S rRNA C2498 (ribose-2'-O)-methylase RlmM